MHGESLAVTYPEFVRFTWESAAEKFAAMGRILDPGLSGMSDAAAAEGSCVAMDGFLKRVGMWLGLEGLGVSRQDVPFIADHSRDLPDYKNNPRVASRDEILAMFEKSWRR
jgi:alcohol dehydrogenase class IV